MPTPRKKPATAPKWPVGKEELVPKPTPAPRKRTSTKPPVKTAPKSVAPAPTKPSVPTASEYAKSRGRTVGDYMAANRDKFASEIIDAFDEFALQAEDLLADADAKADRDAVIRHNMEKDRPPFNGHLISRSGQPGVGYLPRAERRGLQKVYEKYALLLNKIQSKVIAAGGQPLAAVVEVSATDIHPEWVLSEDEARPYEGKGIMIGIDDGFLASYALLPLDYARNVAAGLQVQIDTAERLAALQARTKK